MEKRKLTKEDLPKDVLRELQAEIDKEPKMAALKQQWGALVKKGLYAQALQVHRFIEKIENQVLDEYLREYTGEAERMDKLMLSMTDDDRERMNTNVNSIIFLCDMVETLVSDSNQLLHKYHPHHNLEMFDRLTEIGKEAKDHVRFMASCTKELYQVTFADCADDLTEMVTNKTRSFMRKLRKKTEKVEEKQG